MSKPPARMTYLEYRQWRDLETLGLPEPIQPRRRAQPEREFQAWVVSLARTYGWLPYHTWDSRRSHPGFPDLVLAHPEHGVLFVELKTRSGKLSEAQDHWIYTLDRAGAWVLVWRPGDAEEIHGVLSGAVKRKAAA